jgi:hypothetical protein
LIATVVNTQTRLICHPQLQFESHYRIRWSWWIRRFRLRLLFEPHFPVNCVFLCFMKIWSVNEGNRTCAKHFHNRSFYWWIANDKPTAAIVSEKHSLLMAKFLKK